MNELDKFIDVLLTHLSTATGISKSDLLMQYSDSYQRHYVQAGPWADMIREG